MLKWITSPYPLYFGTDPEQKIEIDNKSESPGIVMGKTTWIKNNFNKNQIMVDLKQPIRVKISADDFSEYVSISDDINVEIK